MMTMRRTGTQNAAGMQNTVSTPKIVHQFLIKLNKHCMTQISYTYAFIL